MFVQLMSIYWQTCVETINVSKIMLTMKYAQESDFEQLEVIWSKFAAFWSLWMIISKLYCSYQSSAKLLQVNIEKVWYHQACIENDFENEWS